MLFASRISGWALLARRFRAAEAWKGVSWSWQSARFRGWFGYNNCLVVGADPQWLSMAMMSLFRLPLHPPLLIPWNEIEVETGKSWYGEWARLRIGNEERVTVRISGRLAEGLRQAAGPGWPLHFQEQQQKPHIC